MISTEKAPNPEEPMTTFKIFFVNPKFASTEDCTEVEAVERMVPYTQSVGKASLEALLAGPTVDEEKAGYGTNIPRGSTLNSLKIVEGEARADFNSVTESGGGSCSMAGRMAQIVETMKQFPTVKSVKLSVEGKTEAIFQP